MLITLLLRELNKEEDSFFNCSILFVIQAGLVLTSLGMFITAGGSAINIGYNFLNIQPIITIFIIIIFIEILFFYGIKKYPLKNTNLITVLKRKIDHALLVIPSTIILKYLIEEYQISMTKIIIIPSIIITYLLINQWIAKKYG